MELLQPIVVLIVGYLVQKAFGLLKVEINSATYNAIVASIVAYLLAAVGAEQAALLF